MNNKITHEQLENRDQAKNRSFKGSTKYKKQELSEEEQRVYYDRRAKWYKEKYTVYTLVLNTNYEAGLILYLDSLESIKPYICELIRKEMANPFIYETAYVREFEQNNCKRRCFSLKLNNEKDRDVIDYLYSKKSIRAYLIDLLKQDIVDTGFVFPDGLEEYNKENKIKICNLHDAYYDAIYECLKEKVDNGETKIKFRDLRLGVVKKMGDKFTAQTYGQYRKQMFGKTGVLTSNSKEQAYLIDADKLHERVE